jgi:cell division protein FtsN
VASRRGKSQARRNNGNGSFPGWAWMVLGIVLTVGVVLALPYLKGGKGDGEGFLRPKPNPEATPAVASDTGDEAVADDSSEEAAPAPKPTQYDFYTLLPADEVAMTDAELAATARAEEERRASNAADAADVAAAEDDDAAEPATTPAADAAPSIEPSSDTPYVLQAGAFGSASDAESLKARIALLGLTARVESAEVRGRTVYRVRMGPYRTASELAEAKRKLTGGGLPAMAIRAK